MKKVPAMSLGITAALPDLFADVDDHEVQNVGLVLGCVHVRSGRSDRDDTRGSVDVDKQITGLLTESCKLMDGGNVMGETCDRGGLQDFIDLGN